MRYDTIVIGGGLSGLTAGIASARGGRRVAMLAKGQSRLNFFSGSFDLLGYTRQGDEVTEPLAAMSQLPDEHPYRRLQRTGADLPALADAARQLLSDAGLAFSGDAARNHYRMTPAGLFKPAWLTLDGFARVDDPEHLPWKHVTLLNIKGFLDYPVDFIAGHLTSRGVTCKVREITLPQLERRRTPAEMRSTAIATVLSGRGTMAALAGEINSATSRRSDVIMMPAVIGLETKKAVAELQRMVNKPLLLVATLPPSVAGQRVHTLLRKKFISLGGTFILGSTVKSGTIENGHVTGLTAKNLPDQIITADEYILAAGSLNSGGVVAAYDRVYEPIFGLDVDAPQRRQEWNEPSITDWQPYMEFGVRTTDNLHALLNGQPVDNLRCIGSILSHNNAVKHANAEGVALLTALHATAH